MKNAPLWILLAMIGLTFAAPLACDDDNNSGRSDDDGTDDDASDDDASDDDASDDDASDDDATDDDASDDDTSDDDEEVFVDSASGLTWQNGMPTTMVWNDAVAYCDTVTWGGASDWRLPTISELRTLIRGCDATAPGGSCTVTDACLEHASCWNETCWSCNEGEGPAGGKFWPPELLGEGGWYWSVSLVSDFPGWAWAIPFWGGDIDSYNQSLAVYTRCVR